ncbi:uncharacterized protein LOC129570818, partial [Sitodiplosis mosellana]|uniref:uncharacterized protein LOC129570818 n=1 Tax=Sitodiplosis mosellana TaxID=263140 RepID=UPI0024445D7A
MIQLLESHTSKNLAIEVKRCLDKFGITLKQVKSITTDNAANVVGIVDHLDEEVLCAIGEDTEEGNSTHQPIELVPAENINNPVSDDEIRDLARQMMEDEALALYLDDTGAYEDLLKKVIEDLPHHFNGKTANVRCGAHTIHLTVRGALKKSNFRELVAVCRGVIKSLRKEAYIRESRHQNLQYSLPHLNVVTRWDSDYTMLNDLLQCKGMVDHFAKTQREFKIIQTKWAVIEEVVSVLKMFFLTTKKLQDVNFTLSDFYGHLIALKENLTNYLHSNQQLSDLATHLQTELNNRLPMLKKNPLMICAVFLDRRYSSELSRDEKALAVRTLVKMWEEIRMEHFANGNGDTENNNDDLSFRFDDHASVIEAYFNSKGVHLQEPEKTDRENPDYTTSNAAMYEILNEFDSQIGRIPASQSVLEFWHKKKTEYPEVYLLSTTINAVPPTQSTTERAFSTLSFVYDDKRTKLSMVLLEQILIIRLNKDLTLDIFEENLMAIT